MTKKYVNSSLDFLIVNVDEDWKLVNNTSRLPPDYPTTPKPRAAVVTSVSPSLVSVTNSLRRQVRSRGVQAWQIDLAYGAMKRDTFAPLWAFLVSRSGQAGKFTVSFPGLTVPRGTAAGSPRVKGGGQSGLAVETDGWSNNSTVLKKADFIELEGDPKIYQVTADVLSNGSGEATVPIFPALRRVPGDNFVIYTDVVFTCALMSDSLPSDFDQCLTTRGFDVSLVEVLS